MTTVPKKDQREEKKKKQRLDNQNGQKSVCHQHFIIIGLKDLQHGNRFVLKHSDVDAVLIEYCLR